MDDFVEFEHDKNDMGSAFDKNSNRITLEMLHYGNCFHFIGFPCCHALTVKWKKSSREDISKQVLLDGKYHNPL